MAKKDNPRVVKAKAQMATVASIAKSKQELIQEVYDAEFKGAVTQYIQNTIDIPAVGGDPKEAETRFLNALKRLRDTQPRVLQLIEGM